MVLVWTGEAVAISSPRETTGVESTQIRWFLGCQAGRWTAWAVTKNTQWKLKTQGGGLPGSSLLRSDGYHGSQIGDTPSERRITERRITERRIIERRITERRITERRKLPNAELLNAERYWTPNVIERRTLLNAEN